MEITFYYDGIMPAALKAKIEAHTGEEILADFPEDESGKDWSSWGNYFIGDNADEAISDEDAPDYSEEFENGFFTREKCIDAVAFFDANIPEEKREKWCLQGGGGWDCQQIRESAEYRRLFNIYSSIFSTAISSALSNFSTNTSTLST